MKTILILGAGKSATALIRNLAEHATAENYEIEVGDLQIDSLIDTYRDNKNVKPFLFTLEHESVWHKKVNEADLVISMLPAKLHPVVAKVCLQAGKNLITPSYQSEEMLAMHEEVERSGLLFLGEMGVDPGIDHMSAMQIINRLKKQGAVIKAFESFTGGLIAPESDTNPWHYKFTWNPSNVIRAGQGSAVKFLHNGKYKYIPYHKLFDRREEIKIEPYGMFEGYANRDSLTYKDLYGLDDVQTLYRGTLRRPPFCSAWHILVQIGATDDSYTMDHTDTMTYRDFINSFLKYRKGDSVELKLAYYLGIDVDSPPMKLLEWAGLFSDEVIGLPQASPADVLQHKFSSCWAMEEEDKDMIVMWHLFNYERDGRSYKLTSSMVSIGEDSTYTAMSRTVGLPIAIAARALLKGQIKAKGVLRPLYPEIYEVVLKELKQYGIDFTETELELGVIA